MISMFAGGLLAGALLTSLTISKPTDEEPLLTIGNRTITKGEHYDMMRNETVNNDLNYGEAILEEQIIQDLMEAKYGDEVSEEYVEDQLKNIMSPFENEKAFDEYLMAEGILKADLVNDIRAGKIMNIAMMDFYPIEEEEMRSFYEDKLPIGMLIQHILVEDKTTAEEVLAKLEQGEDFTDLVFEYSIDEASFDREGTYTMVYGYFIPEFEEAALSLKLNEYTNIPVQTEAGYHIIKLTDEGVKRSFEEEKDNIASEIHSLQAAENPSMYPVIIKNLLEENMNNLTVHEDSIDGFIERLIASLEEIEKEGPEMDDSAIISSEEPKEPKVTPRTNDIH